MLLRCVCAGLLNLALAAGDGPVWVPGPQGRLRVEAAGAGGMPLLLVHGNGGSRRQWAAQMAHFSKTRKVVAFDLRGMGDSDPPKDADYSVQAMAADLHAVAVALELDRFVLLGHSYGGAVAGAYAGQHPERVAGLVFDDVAGDMRGVPPEQAEATLAALAPERFRATTRTWFEEILKQATPATRKAVLADLERTPPAAFTGAWLGLMVHDPAKALDRHPGPKRHLYTDLLAGNGMAIHAAIRGIEATHLPGTSHWPHMDQPQAFNRTLEAFLTRTEASVPAAAIDARAFDFWLGNWEVLSPTGDRIGENRVARELGGKVLVERFTGRSGSAGSSFTTYDAAARIWRQSYVDSEGLVLQLAGTFVQGRMVLSGARSAGDVCDRISWEPRPDGTILQRWECSRDGGRTWHSTFEGRYRRAAAGR